MCVWHFSYGLKMRWLSERTLKKKDYFRICLGLQLITNRHVDGIKWPDCNRCWAKRMNICLRVRSFCRTNSILMRITSECWTKIVWIPEKSSINGQSLQYNERLDYVSTGSVFHFISQRTIVMICLLEASSTKQKKSAVILQLISN